MSTVPDSDLTLDDFLGGQVRVYQPRQGYRAGIDPVLLAAAVPAQPGQTVLELGCGVGVASLCLCARVPGVRVVGLERQAAYADLARRNAALNTAPLQVVTGDFTQMPADLKQESFDHVLANPPYFLRHASTAAQDHGREIALGEDTPLADWVKTAARRLAPKGTATFIHRAERLSDLLAALSGQLGSLEILPLVPRRGRPARLVLVRARKGGRAQTCLHDSFVLHDGPRHVQDQDDYSEAARACLRQGQPLPFAK